MAGILWVLCLSLLVQECFCSLEDANAGCRKWRQVGNDVCCDECYSGNRLVSECGPNPNKLCTPCERDTFTTKLKNKECDPCRQCVGALVLVNQCTESSDTVCGCKEGYKCGDKACSFCVTLCKIGEEPVNRSCRKCPNGTFNNQIHQPCKSWSKECPNPNHQIIFHGNASSDIKCANISVPKVYATKKPVEMELTWPLMLPVAFGMVLICIIIILVWEAHKRRQVKETKEEMGETSSEKLIIGTPSDEPRTLIAIECSFHEAQQEQGSSSESLASKDSSEMLLPSRNT